MTVTAPAILTPDAQAIRADLALMTARWPGLSQPAKFELRALAEGKPEQWSQFTVSRMDVAVAYAEKLNRDGYNVYAVRNPIRLDHRGPANDASIVAAFFCWADCDDPDATSNVKRFGGPKWTWNVKTGSAPHTRVHVYWELEEPVVNLDAWRQMQANIAAHFQSDGVVINPSRIMRLGGTVSYPNAKKRARGYQPELVTLRTKYDDDREPVAFERLMRVFAPAAGPAAAGAGGGWGIDTGDSYEPPLDREAAAMRALSDEAWRKSVFSLVCSYVAKGLTDGEIYAITDTYTVDGYSVADTRQHVAKFIKWARDQEKAKGGFGESPRHGAAPEADAAPESDAEPADGGGVQPVDLWGVFPAPKLPRDVLPKVIEDFAVIQGEMMGADPGGLAAAALCVCCAAIPDDIKLRVKPNETWQESARIWVALVGNPSTKKSPIISAAERPLRKIDFEMFKDFIRRKADYDALPKAEKAEAERPKQVRKRLEDTTIEAAQEVMADSPDGVLVTQDELAGWFGAMDRYGNGKGKDRAFWLTSYNGGGYSYNRIGRGAGMVSNLSTCVLGGIQPELIRKIVGDASDDGLIQRLLPIILAPATLGSEDAPPHDAVAAYDGLVTNLTRVEIDGGGGGGGFHIDTGLDRRPRLRFDGGAQAVRRGLELRHLDLAGIESVSPKLVSHIGKYDGLFARLCVAFHCIEHAGRGMVPQTVSEGTARRVADFMRRFLLPHAFAFYGGVLDLSDDHDRLTAVAGYILAHGLLAVSVRDVQRSVRSMRKLARPDSMRVFEQLEALGWLAQQPAPPRSNASPTWVVNREVHRLFAERRDGEVERRRRVRELLQTLGEEPQE